MKSEYYQIYDEMLRDYHDPREWRRFPLMFAPDYDQGLAQIERAVQVSCEKKGVKLRPDAKFFLVTNFHQMVAVPVTVVQGRSVQNEISKLIQEDIDLIISTAASSPNNQMEISGGTILRTTAHVWDKLKTNAQNVWS